MLKLRVCIDFNMKDLSTNNFLKALGQWNLIQTQQEVERKKNGQLINDSVWIFLYYVWLNRFCSGQVNLSPTKRVQS